MCMMKNNLSPKYIKGDNSREVIILGDMGYVCFVICFI